MTRKNSHKYFLCSGRDSNLWSWNPLDLEADALPIEPPHPINFFITIIVIIIIQKALSTHKIHERKSGQCRKNQCISITYMDAQRHNYGVNAALYKWSLTLLLLFLLSLLLLLLLWLWILLLVVVLLLLLLFNNNNNTTTTTTTTTTNNNNKN